MKVVDMTGKVVGRWRVLRRDFPRRGRAHWVCLCAGCGAQQSVAGSHLREGVKGGCRSCRRRGLAGEHPAEYAAWQNIKTRVRRLPTYKALGMDTTWQRDFGAFLAHIGTRPSPAHSVDRIKTSKGYFPGNVRWATAAEQANNTKRNRVFAYRGKKQTLAQWARELNVNYSSVHWRIQRGVPFTEAIKDVGPYVDYWKRLSR